MDLIVSVPIFNALFTLHNQEYIKEESDYQIKAL